MAVDQVFAQLYSLPACCCWKMACIAHTKAGLFVLGLAHLVVLSQLLQSISSMCILVLCFWHCRLSTCSYVCVRPVNAPSGAQARQ